MVPHRLLRKPSSSHCLWQKRLYGSYPRKDNLSWTHDKQHRSPIRLAAMSDSEPGRISLSSFNQSFICEGGPDSVAQFGGFAFLRPENPRLAFFVNDEGRTLMAQIRQILR